MVAFVAEKPSPNCVAICKQPCPGKVSCFDGDNEETNQMDMEVSVKVVVAL